MHVMTHQAQVEDPYLNLQLQLAFTMLLMILIMLRIAIAIGVRSIFQRKIHLIHYLTKRQITLYQRYRQKPT